MGGPPMIERLHFHRGYSLRLHKSKPFINYGIIRHIITQAALHTPNVAPGDVEGHGLDGFAFKCTELPDHIVEEVLAGLAPRETGPELVMERPEVVKKSVHITGGEIKWRDGEL